MPIFWLEGMWYFLFVHRYFFSHFYFNILIADNPLEENEDLIHVPGHMWYSEERFPPKNLYHQVFI